MALGTVTSVKRGYIDGMAYQICDLQLTSGANYVTNGDTFTAANIPGASSTAQVFGVFVISTSSQGGPASLITYDAATTRLRAYGTAGSASGLTEIANGTDLSAQKARILVLYNTLGS
jgi:hypothetical protein